MPDLGKQVVELHRAGVRSIDIAHRLNVALSTVHYHLRKLADQQAVEAEPPRRTKPRDRSPAQTRAVIAALLNQGTSRAEIARRLGVAKSTVSYHARLLGQTIDGRCRRRYDWAAVQAFYDDGHSVRECRAMFGFSTATWHEAVKRGAVTPRPGFRPLDEIFAANTRRNRGHLKLRLLRMGLKQPRCERCGLSEWRGRPLSVALHHVNGDRNDNRIENLELLCPNCHSQTNNYSGRNTVGRCGAPQLVSH